MKIIFHMRINIELKSKAKWQICQYLRLYLCSQHFCSEKISAVLLISRPQNSIHDAKEWTSVSVLKMSQPVGLLVPEVYYHFCVFSSHHQPGFYRKKKK